jgi:hypothetical protein
MSGTRLHERTSREAADAVRHVWPDFREQVHAQATGEPE